ncbi:hypothetical protein KUTG_05548 [Kutzneria sp. 744]|nr:hypothetical protein KUTG_05548 [Kutzneria sp. 744]
MLLLALVGGYLWIQYGGSVVAEGRATVRVTYAGAGDPVLAVDFASGDQTAKQTLTTSALSLDRGQAPQDVRKGDLLDCAYIERMAPIVERLREPVLSDCRRAAG